MKREDRLHQLIHSLDKSEKRLFKMYVSTQQKGEDNNYLKLFDAINDLADYDEDKLSKKLGKNSNLIKNLPQNKKYLKDTILKSMREINENRIEDEIAALMKDQHFLSKKNLFKEQWNKLQKAKTLTTDYELYEKHIEILDLEMLFLNEQDLNKAIEEYADYKKTKENLLYKINLANNLISSKNRIFHFVSKYRNKISDSNLAIVAKEMEQYNKNDIDNSNSFTIKMWYYNTLSNYYLLANNSEKQFECQKTLVNLFNEYPQFKQSNTRRYLIIFFNYMGAIFKLENFELLKKELDSIAKIKVANDNDKGEFYQNYTLYTTLYAMNTGKLNEAMSQSKKVTANLKKYENKINASSLLTLYYNYALIFFFAEDFGNAILWLDKIKDIKSDVRKDLQAFASVLTLICHYELKSYLLIESLYRSTNRNYELSSIEKAICNTVKKASNTANYKKEDWEKLKTNLTNYTDRMVGRVLLTFWIDSHLKKEKGINDFYRESIKK